MHRSFPADSSRIESASTLGLRPRRHFATLANGLALGAAAFYCLTAGLVGDIRASKAGQPTACDPRPRNARIKLSQPPDSFNPPGPIPPILRISIPPSQSKRPSTAFRGWRTAQSRRRAHPTPVGIPFGMAQGTFEAGVGPCRDHPAGVPGADSPTTVGFSRFFGNHPGKIRGAAVVAAGSRLRTIRGSCELEVNKRWDTAMPKMKTHKGLKKRVKVTANGKVVHKRANSGHLMSGKSGGRCRSLRRPAVLKSALRDRIKEALGKAGK